LEFFAVFHYVVINHKRVLVSLKQTRRTLLQPVQHVPQIEPHAFRAEVTQVTSFDTGWSKPVGLKQWYSTFSVLVPPDVISLQHCTLKAVDV
jgi:hypothetical protein